ncbi:long-chain-fatty-acid-CoA ligase [Rhodopirellula maiorica SM1]|uniref:Long-chain-fatty-acid-CoA ligase n=1 Tax=Rhodopirellula maiorica SM1 TaxID=1265738 RepID=M5S4W0_9BACT|nr:AMP-binding protein [Rhodopirellula maiorica]EMI21224.1 long-chain-fatty-acid-CoA ligase [Rhodopirellula maiorica SM1]
MIAIRNQNETTKPWVDGLTIGQVLKETARRHPQNDAIVFCDPPNRMTWSELDDAVTQVASGLLAVGFRPGDHFGVWATNVPQWVLLQFATARIGVVLVNINPSYRADELKYALQQSEVRGLALIDHHKSTHFWDILNQACPDLATAKPGALQSAAFPKLKWIIGLRGESREYAIMWDEFVGRAETAPASEVLEIAENLRCTDAINIQYTSGTTGHPKGATLSHRNILLNAFYAGQSQRLGPSDRIALPVPLYHCFGCVLGTLCCLVHGSAMVFPSECFSAVATLDAIEKERCTAVYGVPTMFIAQLEHPSYAGRDLTSLRTGIMAGSPCPIELMKHVTTDMGAAEMTIGYGQTEASPLITQTRTDDPIELRVGTVGRPLPGFEAKIVDPITNEELDDGKQGEFCGRGHGVMLGYYNMPEKTAAVIDDEGWLHTGDLGMRQSNGYFRITGRLHDMIIRGGENIYPREIEERLYQHPAVEDVQVVGVPDRRFGEEVLAWVKLKVGSEVSEAELREFCNESLARFKVPHYWKVVDQFPTTVTGKIQKYKIREAAIEELGLQAVAKIQTA